MTQVLDSSVLLAGMSGETGGDILDTPSELFHISAVNLAEVYTKIPKRGGRAETVEHKWAQRALGIDIRLIR